MYKKIRQWLSSITFVAVIFLFFWNIYTITFHGYVTNGVWETYYEEEPGVFIADLTELTLEMFFPIIIIFVFYVTEIIADWLRPEEPSVSEATKAKRLRRKKRKRKRKR